MLAGMSGHKELKEFLENCENEWRPQGDRQQEMGQNELDDHPSAPMVETGAIKREEETLVPKFKSKFEVQRHSGVMIKAAQDDNAAVCEALLKSGVDPNETLDKDDYTALHIASLHGSRKVVKLLLDSGARANIKSRRGFGPIHDTATYNETDIIRVLVQAGANLSARDRRNKMQTPLHLASLAGNLEAVQTIIELAESAHNSEPITKMHQLDSLGIPPNGIESHITQITEKSASGEHKAPSIESKRIAN